MIVRWRGHYPQTPQPSGAVEERPRLERHHTLVAATNHLAAWMPVADCSRECVCMFVYLCGTQRACVCVRLASCYLGLLCVRSRWPKGRTLGRAARIYASHLSLPSPTPTPVKPQRSGCVCVSATLALIGREEYSGASRSN